MKKYFNWIWVCFLFSLLYCGSAWNPFEPEELPPDYLVNNELVTPEGVIQKLQNAYSRKELTEYLDCLSDDFIFILRFEDQTYFQLQQNWWDKAHEQEIHRNLFLHALEIQLKLIQVFRREVADDEVQVKYQYQLNVYDDRETRYSADGFAQFTLVKNVDGWRIKIWQDLLY